MDSITTGISSKEQPNVTTINNESLQKQLGRSAMLRATIKQFYIYIVLFLIVLIFSLLKLDEVAFFERGHFLSPDSIINLLRSAVPILTLSGAFTLLMISGYIDLSVGSAMSLSAVVFAWLILNGISQWLHGHETAHYACDRNPRDPQPVQGHRAADRSGWIVSH